MTGAIGELLATEAETKTSQLFKEEKMAVRNKERVFDHSALPERVLEGGRNSSIFYYGISLQKQGMGEKQLARTLKEANETHCVPPMSQSEVEGIIRNVMSYKADKPIGSGKVWGKGYNEARPGMSPTEQAAQQLEALFSATDLITFVTYYKKGGKGKWMPRETGKGKAGRWVIAELREATSFKDVFPDYNEKAGIHFCINPVSRYGQRKNSDIRCFRHALVEYDDIPKEEQVRRMLESGLPISSIVDSGGKSIHALVRVDARDEKDYRKRVALLYDYLERKFGSRPDIANKNASRLSRLAGAKRGENMQRLLYTEVNLNADFMKVVSQKHGRKEGEKLTHADIGDRLIADKGACIVEGVPVLCSSGKYQIGQEAVSKAIIEEDRNATAHFRREVVDYLKLTAPSRHQAPTKYIRFKNGVLNLESMELLQGRSSLMLLNEIPHDWNPEARSTLVDETFDAIAAGDEAVIANLWEMFGLCLYRGHEVSRMLLLQGSGANGKSTLLHMLKHMLGAGNWFSLSVQDLGEKFQLVPAMGKLALIGDDIASDFVGGKACATMKKFVTGETVTDQYKGGSTFQFEPYATLIYSCNEIPRFADSSFGFERRIHPIPLSARFSPGDENFDPGLRFKLCDEPCMEYAIVKSVEALKRCLARYALTPNRLSDDMRSDILQESDPTLAYARERKREGYKFSGKKNSEVYGDYTQWCSEKGYDPVNLSTFSKKLCSHEGLKSQGSNGARVYVPRV